MCGLFIKRFNSFLSFFVLFKTFIPCKPACHTFADMKLSCIFSFISGLSKSGLFLPLLLPLIESQFWMKFIALGFSYILCSPPSNTLLPSLEGGRQTKICLNQKILLAKNDCQVLLGWYFLTILLKCLRGSGHYVISQFSSSTFEIFFFFLGGGVDK